MKFMIEGCCPKPHELVGWYLDGYSIENLTKPKMFTKKEYARAYVERVIYDYHMKLRKS